MKDIVGKKWVFFFFSGLIIASGLVSLSLFGLRLSIDFTGGTLWEFRVAQSTEKQPQFSLEDLREAVAAGGFEASSIQSSGEDTYLLRLKPLGKEESKKIQKAVEEKAGEVENLRFEIVGPVISQELTRKAIWALSIALVAIVLYIAWAFRSVPKPASSWRFGGCAIFALFHDVLIVTGAFSLLGHFNHIEVDVLFITALLTIIGFSVHDTIVVFDRVRENLKKMPNTSFSQVVNESILQTLTRSINTSVTVIFVLFALLLLGGVSLRWFIVALIIGITSGTYSSIFTASPLLVLWHDFSQKRKSKS